MRTLPTDRLKVLIVYYSRFGAVRQLAELIAEGARSVEDVEASLLEVEDMPAEVLHLGETESDMARRRAALLNELTSADALIVGAPGYFGSMASPLKRFFEDCATASAPPATDRTRPWRHFRFHNKVGAAFTATGTPHGGNEATLHTILTMLMGFGMIIVTPGQQQPILENETAPYGVTTITGPKGDRPPTAQEQSEARALGKRVAEIASWLTLGWREWESQREVRERAKPRGSENPLG
jgi:NAD(P)H dehydrogenase (quinone)